MRAFFSSFKFAFQGIAHTLLSQRNMRIHVFVAVCALIACVLLKLQPVEWGIILLCIGLVMAAECINTAVEAVVDLASPEVHQLAKIAKDCAAGAVLILAIASVVVGLIVYISAFLRLVG